MNTDIKILLSFATITVVLFIIALLKSPKNKQHHNNRQLLKLLTKTQALLNNSHLYAKIENTHSSQSVVIYHDNKKIALLFIDKKAVIHYRTFGDVQIFTFTRCPSQHTLYTLFKKYQIVLVN